MHKVMTEEAGQKNLLYVIEVVKKAWYFGQVLLGEFSRLINILQTPGYLKFSPFILGCFRLNNEFEIAEGNFNSVVEICTLMLKFSADKYDLYVPAKLNILGETYYRINYIGQKEYIQSKLQKNVIFGSKSFWTNYLLYTLLVECQEDFSATKQGLPLEVIQESARTKVGNVFLNFTLELCNAGVKKQFAEDILKNYMDRFRLNDKQKTQILNFLAEFKTQP